MITRGPKISVHISCSRRRRPRRPRCISFNNKHREKNFAKLRPPSPVAHHSLSHLQHNRIPHHALPHLNHRSGRHKFHHIPSLHHHTLRQIPLKVPPLSSLGGASIKAWIIPTKRRWMIPQILTINPNFKRRTIASNPTTAARTTRQRNRQHSVVTCAVVPQYRR
jgi:hypothetical protein